MDILIWVIGIILFLGLICLLTAFICFVRVFYIPDKMKKEANRDDSMPVGRIYEPFREIMGQWRRDSKKLPQREVSIISFDGLKLYGTYYEFSPNAPIEILFHGYQGNSARDLSGGIFRCFSLGHSALLIDHRAGGKSEGNITTFGVKECRDCLDWIDFVINNINKDAKIIIGGVSMGASTVMLASSEDLPENVVGILADCGYSSGEAIIKKVIKDMKLPPNLLFPFVRLGGKIFGRFDINDANPAKALKKCKTPIIFLHGTADKFVPHEMSLVCYNACNSRKRMVSIEGAGHGLCFPVDKEKYISELAEFFKDV